jgi:predicted NBD/HSP70 family sugar kinase
MPVFINNDGDLFAFGEALAGVLPEINNKLKEKGIAKQYKNLIGYTFGTGLGVGIVIDGTLNQGDNSCVETFCQPNKKYSNIIAEDSVSIRAIKRVYGELDGNLNHNLEPKEICEIAAGKLNGNKEAALKSFDEFGEIAGYTMSNAITLIDGIIVIGGGLTGAKEFYKPAMFREFNQTINTMSGDTINRLQFNVYDLDDDSQFDKFAKGESRELKVYGSDKTVIYDPEKRIGVATSRIGASKAISLGAYAFALNKIDRK